MADFDFRLLHSSGQPMPIVPVRFPRIPQATFTGLVDSGAAATRLPAELAMALDVDLDGAPTEGFVAGGASYTCYMADVELAVGTMKPRVMTVGFTVGWVPPHFLLGIRGFFDTYAVTIRTSNGAGRTSVRPNK